MRSRVSIFLVLLGCYLALSSAFATSWSVGGCLDSATLQRYDPNVVTGTLQVSPAGGKPATSAPAKPKPASGGSSEAQTALVDYEADRMYDRGDEITRLVGNVLFHHNGAIIQCDSAFQYDKNRMDFFGKVIIYQDSTYIYGDRVNYNGQTAVADVFAPIIKTMRGDMTLYTYNLSFNTKTNVGVYYGGGVLNSKDKLMESYRGEFNAKTNVVKFMDSVAMSSDSYIIRTDSLDYNLDSETATFLDKTYIWDHDRDFMLANRGNYFANQETYLFTDSAYIMTPDNELWADSVRYLTPVKQAFMHRNVQILDTANNTLAFGDWGFYDDSLGRAVMTDTPSVRSWQDSDTSYMRADTIRMLSFEPGMSKKSESEQQGLESAEELEQIATALTDSLAAIPDSVRYVRDTLPPPPPDSLPARPVDSLAVKMADSLPARPLDSLPVTDSLPMVVDSLPERPLDSLTVQRLDSLPVTDSLPMVTDSLPMQRRDSLPVADSLSLKTDSLPLTDSGSMPMADSTKKPEKERVMRAYHHVRTWSADYQAVCDSTVSFSVDSTAVMYGKPVLWSENNQITADRIDVYTKNEQMDWAEFIDNPFISQQVLPRDTLQFNQASGKNMKVYFKDNEIDYAWMSGNVMNIYYMDEQKKGYKDVVALAAISCADLTIFFEGRQPSRMLWGGAGEGPIYPIEKIPDTQERFLEGFTWQDSIRPQNAKEICNRVVVPSFRATASQFYKPAFSINSAMEMSKEQFKTGGSWHDRTEPIAVLPEYFEQRNRDLLF